ncbi:MAG: hypothetical protein U5L02_10270 [Rheinheimera sp.]|nr:hypothetical protein [Rheinheimera sp.]
MAEIDQLVNSALVATQALLINQQLHWFSGTVNGHCLPSGQNTYCFNNMEPHYWSHYDLRDCHVA